MMSYQNETGSFQSPDNLKLFYQRWIPNNPKQGCNIVLHHGLGEHSGRYGNILGMLEGTGITVYTYDVRGHGRSDGKKGLAKNLTSLAEDLDAFLQFINTEFGVSKPLLYGHSMGGSTVLTFVGKSKANQEKIKALVVTGPALGVDKNCYQIVMASLLTCLRTCIPNTTLPSGLEAKNLTRDQNSVEAYKNDELCHDKISISLAFSLLENGPTEIIPSAKDMTLPIFLAHGGKDIITDPKGTQLYYDSCASTDKTIKIYPDCLHEIHNELKDDKETFLADVKSFITSHV